MADQYQYVKLPDGSYGKFSSSASDDDIQAQIAKDFPQTAQAPAPSQHPYLDAAENFGKGLVKSGIGLVSSADNAVSKIPGIGTLLTTPIGQAPTPQNSARATAYAQQMATPHGTAQSVGKTIGNIAQFAIPGGAEEAAATRLAPMVGKLAAKALPAAVTGAVINKAQGGTVSSGAIAGLGGSLVGSALHAVAPSLAETAMGTRRIERAYGKDPGLAVLEDTTGVRPSSIVKSARQKIGELAAQNDTMANAYPGMVSTQGGQDVINQSIAQATKQGQRGVAVPQAQEVLKNLTENPHLLGPNTTPGLARATLQPASVVQDLKRGLRADYVTNWNPETMKGTRQLAAQASGALDHSLDNALGPQYAANNDRISGLMAVSDAMGRKAEDPSLMQKLGQKIVAPTGGLLGAFGGYHEAGIPGAIAGLVLPNIVASPTAQMIAARTAYSPATAAATKLAAYLPLAYRSGASQ